MAEVNEFYEEGTKSVSVSKDQVVLQDLEKAAEGGGAGGEGGGSGGETAEEKAAKEAAAKEAAANPEAAAKAAEEAAKKAAETAAANENTKGEFFEKFKTAAPENKAADEKKPETPENKEVVIPDDVKQKLESYEAELKKYKELPLAKLLGGDYDLTQVDLKDLLKKAVGEDYSNLPDEKLIEKSLKANPMFEQLSEDEQKEEIESLTEKFKGMSKLELLTERGKLISSLSSAQPNEILAHLQEIQEAQKKLVNPDEFFEKKTKETFDQTFEKVRTEVSTLSKSIVGQSYKGYTATEEDAAKTEQIFSDQVLNFNTDVATFNAFKAATYDSAVEAAEKRGYEKGIKEQTNPNRNEAGGGGAYMNTKEESSLSNATTADFFEQANKQ